ncbi:MULTISPECIES: ATP-binding protein [unclassified Actinomadura]|uniref:ATP-binding protein n=1 Tax=unclassified Actinomadura TaxID=2626254 RepID=UPI00280AAF18|nr:ATP-binding protein [Actinomadura sp. K4S16]
MEITMDLVLPRDVASVPATRKLLDAALAALGVEGHIRDDIEMMLTEACTNVIKHAEHGADYTVRAMIQDRRCVIKVIDSGTGFDAARFAPPDPSAENGRGLMIMRALADDVRFASFPEDGALVALEKRLTYGEDSLGGLLTADSELPLGDGSRPGSDEIARRLFEMARAGDTRGILSHVDAGVPVNLSDHRGETLLMHAACHGHPETVRALTLRGADPDRANDLGHRPLAGAVFKRETEVVRALLEAGADPLAGSPSAADTARLVGDTELLAWFEEAAPPPA